MQKTQEEFKMATILDGKALSVQCKETIRKQVEELADEVSEG